MKSKILIVMGFFLLGMIGHVGLADEDDSPEETPEPIKGMNHKEKSGLDDDKIGELKDWQVTTLTKLISDPSLKNIDLESSSPALWEQKLKKAQAEKDPAKLACVYLNLFSVADKINRTSPSLTKYSETEKEKWAALGVFSKQVIGDNVDYRVSDELLSKVINAYPKSKCGQIARIEKISFVISGMASGESCYGKEYIAVRKLGLDYLKDKNLTSVEKALTYYFLAKAYQTEWSLAFADQAGDFDPQDYIPVHALAKSNMVKYYKLLEKEIPSLKTPIEHILKRIDDHVNLGAEYDCHPREG